MATSREEGEGIAKALVQLTVRCFYPPMAAIVLDQLILRGAYRDDELATRVGMTSREVTKTAHRLVEDQIISVHRRQELREGAPKAQQRTYFFMDYSHATDVIKWRMWKLQNTIDVKQRSELETVGYNCPRCRKTFTLLDYASLMDPSGRDGLFCDVCGTAVRDNENEMQLKSSKDRMRRYIEQTVKIRDLLKRMDDVVLHKFDAAKWLEVNGPEGSTATGPAAVTTTTNGTVRITIAGDDDEELMKRQRELDAAEKRAQNQLPTWIAQSTINSAAALDSEDLSLRSPLASTSTLPFSSNFPPSKPFPNPASDGLNEAETEEVDLSSYYASLASAAAASSHSGPDPEPPIPPVFIKKEEDLPDEDDEAGAQEEEEEEELGMDVQGLLAQAVSTTEGAGGTGSGKRSRAESMDVDSPLPENDKRPRMDEGGAGQEGEEDDFDDDEFDEVEGDANPMIRVGEREVPFLEMTQELQDAMTPDEYTAFWDVYQRLG